MKKNDYSQAFFVVTSGMKWGRDVTLLDAFKAAIAKPTDVNIFYQVTEFLFKRDTKPEDRKNVLHCFYVNDRGSVGMCDGLTTDDLMMIDDCLCGWSTWDNEKQHNEWKVKEQKKKERWNKKREKLLINK